MRGLAILKRYSAIRSELGFKSDEEFLAAYKQQPSIKAYTELFKLRMLGIATYLDEMEG